MSHDYLSHNDDVLLPIFDDSNWPLAQLAKAVDTDYKTTDCPADRVMEILHPKEIGVELKKTWYDIGKNGTSIPVLRLRAPKGHMVRVLFSEGWMEAGGLDMRYVHEQAFTVISDGKERIVEPMFTWFGYRYLMVEGDADLECVKVIHANVPVSSRFSCDNETLNWLYSATVNGLLTNMHGGIVSDCPQVERRGYTGDGQNTCHTALTLLDAQKYYNKWIQDVSDCQDTLSGHVQYTAPYYESGGGSGGWGCAIVEMPYQYYKHFGDLGFLRDMYDQILQYFEYMESHSVNHLLVRDKEGAWCLGDWCPPTNMTILLPPPMVNNYFYIRSLKEMIEVAPLLGKEADIPLFEKRIQEREDAIMAAYFNPADGDFAGGQQGANAFAVDLGLGDERTYQRLVKRYEKLGGYDTGIFGTPILTRVLFEHGNPELAVKLLLSENPCSYEVMRRMGATTLWENWPNAEWDRSRNHPMFGAVTAYLFDYLLGIRQKADSAGYRELVIAPTVVPQMNHASGARQIPAGQVSVAWEKCATRRCVSLWRFPRA